MLAEVRADNIASDTARKTMILGAGRDSAIFVGARRLYTLAPPGRIDCVDARLGFSVCMGCGLWAAGCGVEA
jgi:hypothetical protein